MAAIPDLCPACGALVRHDWNERCGSCGKEWASLLPPPDASTAVSLATKTKHSPWIIGGGAAVAVIIVAAAILLGAPKNDDKSTKLAAAPISVDKAGAALANGTAVGTPTTGAPETTTTFANPQAALKAAADITNSSTTFTYTSKVTSSVDGVLMTESGSWDGTKQLLSASQTEDGKSVSLIYDKKNQVAFAQGADIKNSDNKPWAKLSNSSMSDLDAQDPTGSADYLKLAGSSTKLVGTDTLNGEPTKHYTWTMTSAQMQASGDPDLASLGKEFGNGIALTADVWVGNDNVLRKMLMLLNAPGATSGGVSITETVTNVGKPVSISTPPADLISKDTKDL